MAAPIAFGPFELDPDRGTLLRDGNRWRSGTARRPARDAGRGTGPHGAKEELLAQVWPGTIVEEGNLTVQIAALRKALGPTPDGQSGS